MSKLKDYTRRYPRFALCGLNCGLCPRYHTAGESRCPGCGGEGFHLKHPTCAVMTCNNKHDRAEYCFQCSAYPCQRFAAPSQTDSFISYRNVITDFARAREGGLESYMAELDEKVAMLEFLIQNYDDGRRKGLYCLAVNMLSLDDLRSVLEQIQLEHGPPGSVDSADSAGGAAATAARRRAEWVVALMRARAAATGVELRLRRQ